MRRAALYLRNMDERELQFQPYQEFHFKKSDFTEYIAALQAHLSIIKNLQNAVTQIRRDGIQLSDFETLGQPDQLAKYVKGVAGFQIQEVIQELQQSQAMQSTDFSGKPTLEQSPEEIEVELRLREAHLAKAKNLSSLEEQQRVDRLQELKQREQQMADEKQRQIEQDLQRKNQQKLMLLNSKQHVYQTHNQRVEAQQKAFKLKCEQEQQRALLTVGALDEKRLKIQQLNKQKMREEQLRRKARLKQRAQEKLAMQYAVYGRYSEMADQLMTGNHVE